MTRFVLMVLCACWTAVSVGCVSEEPGEEAEELACLRVDAAETCAWPSMADLDVENQRFNFPDGWMGVYATAASRDEWYELEDEKSVELGEYFGRDPDEYLGYGVRGRTWTYDLYLMHESRGDMFVLTGAGIYYRDDEADPHYALIWGFWYGERPALKDLFEQFVDATEIVDWE